MRHEVKLRRHSMMIACFSRSRRGAVPSQHQMQLCNSCTAPGSELLCVAARSTRLTSAAACHPVLAPTTPTLPSAARQDPPANTTTNGERPVCLHRAAAVYAVSSGCLACNVLPAWPHYYLVHLLLAVHCCSTLLLYTAAGHCCTRLLLPNTAKHAQANSSSSARRAAVCSQVLAVPAPGLHAPIRGCPHLRP